MIGTQEVRMLGIFLPAKRDRNKQIAALLDNAVQFRKSRIKVESYVPRNAMRTLHRMHSRQNPICR